MPFPFADPCFRRGRPIHPTQRHRLPKGRSSTLDLSPECCRSTTNSVLDLPLNGATHFQLWSWTRLRHTNILSARSDSCLRTSPWGVILQAVAVLWRSRDVSLKVVYPTCHLLEGRLVRHHGQICRSLARKSDPRTSSIRDSTYSTFDLTPTHSLWPKPPSAHTSVKWTPKKRNTADTPPPRFEIRDTTQRYHTFLWAPSILYHG